MVFYRGPARFHRLTPNKRFEPVFSTVTIAVYSLFNRMLLLTGIKSVNNRMLLLTDLIPVSLLRCGRTVNHTSFEWIRAIHHIYRIIRHMQGL